MITAEEARRLANRKYTEIYDAIENIARKGGRQYELYRRSSNKISDELKNDLESIDDIYSLFVSPKHSISSNCFFV